MNFGSLIGILACTRCKNQYIRVELINLGRSTGIDHVDFYCAVCGEFINHFDVSPYTKQELDVETKKVLDEANEELSS